MCFVLHFAISVSALSLVSFISLVQSFSTAEPSCQADRCGDRWLHISNGALQTDVRRECIQIETAVVMICRSNAWGVNASEQSAEGEHCFQCVVSKHY